jgi:hypothetical protein
MEFFQEFTHKVPDLLSNLITLLLGWIVGQRLTVYWNVKQKRKEMQMIAAEKFQGLYGEFFSVWKLWNYYIRDIGPSAFPNASRWELLNRVSIAESSMEALFVRLSTDKTLNDSEIIILSRFRQAYQSLREAIRDNQALKWESSNQPEYIEFKTLAVKVAYIILSDQKITDQDVDRKVDTLLKITNSAKWEGNWVVN